MRSSSSPAVPPQPGSVGPGATKRMRAARTQLTRVGLIGLLAWASSVARDAEGQTLRGATAPPMPPIAGGLAGARHTPRATHARAPAPRPTAIAAAHATTDTALAATATATGAPAASLGPPPLVPAPALSTATKAPPPLPQLLPQASASPEAHAPTAETVATASANPASPATGWTAKGPDDESSPAMRYGEFSGSACMEEAARRGLPLVPVASARGVVAPVRLGGPLHGIYVHSAIPERDRATSPYEIMDCRLVLAVDDLTALLADRDVTEIVHMSSYRPPYKGYPAGKPGTRHEGALAIDIGTFVKRDGTKLVVDTDYHGYLGQKPCGEGSAPTVSTAEARELRALTCDVLAAKLFSVFLTPGFNAAHHNHFHAEVAAHSRGFYIR